MATVLVTGANRGLGLEFCKQYAQDNWNVIACCREPEKANALLQLSKEYKNVQIFGLDLNDFAQITHLAQQLNDVAIDVLLNNAGVYGDKSTNGFGHLDYDAWQKNMQINLFAPVKMTEVFLPHVQKSTQKKVVAITSLMGSIGDNGSGGSILYRSSKAALNAAMKSIAIDNQHKNITVLILHPGWVKTDMGGLNAPMEITESITKMRRTIAEFTIEKTGQFLRYDATSLPW